MMITPGTCSRPTISGNWIEGTEITKGSNYQRRTRPTSTCTKSELR